MSMLRIQCRRLLCNRARLRFAIALALGGWLLHTVDLVPSGDLAAPGAALKRPAQQVLGHLDGAAQLDAAADVQAACAGIPPTPPAPPLGRGKKHVLQFNVLNGAHDLVRRERLCAWLRLQQADVVTLNELNFWEQAELEAFGARCGYAHAALLVTNSPYRVGALSRTEPIDVLGRYLKGFGHGALHFAVAGWHYVVTHLNPEGGAVGLAEARRLLTHINASVAAGVPLLILGDLNCLSPHDAETYDAWHLASVLDKKKIQTGKSKHGLASKFLTKRGDAVNYATFNAFLAAGFTDLQPQASAGQQARHETAKWARQTVPTSLHDDAMHAAPMRLDYALANRAAAQLLRLPPPGAPAGAGAGYGYASAVQTAVTDELSDHFPLRVVLCQPDTLGGGGCDALPPEFVGERREAAAAPRLACESSGWGAWWARSTDAKQREAKRKVAAAEANTPKPASQAAAVAAVEAGHSAPGAVDWRDPLLWRVRKRAAPQLASDEEHGEGKQTVVGRLGTQEAEDLGWKVVRVRGRSGESCSQACINTGRAHATADAAVRAREGAGRRLSSVSGVTLNNVQLEKVPQLFGHVLNMTNLRAAEAAEKKELERMRAAVPVSQADSEGGCTLDTDDGGVGGFCQNGGLCIDVFGTFVCSCAAGFEGPRCEVESAAVAVGEPDGSEHPFSNLGRGIAQVAAKAQKEEDALAAEVRAGKHGGIASDLLRAIEADTVNRGTVVSMLRGAGRDGVPIPVLAMLRKRYEHAGALPESLAGAPAQQAPAAMKKKPAAPQLQIPEGGDWACSDAQMKLAFSNDCETLTAEFGCENGCRLPPAGYPHASDAAPCWTPWNGDMLPKVCLLAPTPAEEEEQKGEGAGGDQEVGGCLYGAPLAGCASPLTPDFAQD